MKIPDGTPLSISILINKCWANEPDDRPTFGEIVNDIYNIILELAIVDPQAREWWKSNFFTSSGLDEEVPWEIFQEKVVETLKSEGKGDICASYTQSVWTSFHAILSKEWNEHKGCEKINIEEFSSVVGFLDGFSSGFDHMITLAHNLTKSLWFCGWVDGDIMEDKKFYIRFCNSAYGCYTLCFFQYGKEQGKIRLNRNESNNFVFEGEEMGSLEKVVEEVTKRGYEPYKLFLPYKWISCESSYI